MGDNSFFKKIPGYKFGILFSCTMLFTLLTSMILHSITDPISLKYHWVSNLGIGENGAAEAFAAGMIINSIFGLFFNLSAHSLVLDTQKRIVKIFNHLGFFFGVIGQLGAIAIVIFPYRNEPLIIDIHIIAAFAGFFPTAFMGLCYSLAYKIEKKITPLLNIILLGFIALLLIFPFVFSDVVASLVFVDAKNMFSLTYREFITIMSSMDRDIWPIRMLEWISMFYIVIWAFFTSLNIKKFQTPQISQTPQTSQTIQYNEDSETNEGREEREENKGNEEKED